MNPTQYRCTTCQKNWPKDQMGDGLYVGLKYCPACDSLCDPITEPKEVQPPDGFLWHCMGWTPNMLPDGWRPLLLNEPCETGDQVLVSGQWREGIDTGARMTPRHLPTRTRRPLPGASAIDRSGHYFDEEQKAKDDATGAQAETPLESALAWADEIVQLESVALGRAKRNIQALASAARDLTASREECEKLRDDLAVWNFQKEGWGITPESIRAHIKELNAQLTAKDAEIAGLRKDKERLLKIIETQRNRLKNTKRDAALTPKTTEL